MKHLTKVQCAYIAGFLDGDGSIYIRLKPNKDYRFNYQVSPNIVFYQSRRNRLFLERVRKMIGAGYIRERNDGMVEYVIGDVTTMVSLLTQISPFLVFKKKQAQMFLRIVRKKAGVKTKKDFISLAEMIDKLERLNYSKKRRITSQVVVDTLKKL